MLVPWLFRIFIGVHGLGMDGWYTLGINDHFRILLGLYTRLGWFIVFILRAI
jgi:hypothetical protein